MKFTEKVKRFFTLSAKHEGFTLVELIVVIAILAILAGVAVPAYSGYIKKANRAGDMTLLSAVNKAFASACVTAGSDISLVTEAGLDATVGSPIKGITGVKATGTIDADAVKSGFQMLFVDENPNAAFEVIQPVFVAGIGFVAVDEVTSDATFSVGYGGGVIGVTGAQLSAIKDSVFAKVGIGNILTTMDSVTGIAAGLAENGSVALNTILNDEAFHESALLAMGYSEEEIGKMSKSDKANKVNELCLDMNKESGTAISQIQANAAVLYAAQQTSKMTETEINDFLKTASADDIVNTMASGDAKGLAQAALVCGMYTAFVSNNPEMDQTVDTASVLAALGDPDSEFNAYLSNSANYQDDLDGYLSAMEIINSSSGDPNAVEHLMTNGFANDELKNLVGGLLG